MKEQYQDEWAGGNLISNGVRDCGERYRDIHNFLSQFSFPLTVLDIGCNLGYFSARLERELGACCVAVEGDSDYHEGLLRTIRANKCERVIPWKRRLSLNSLQRLGEVESFDVVLALSVIHHFNEPPSEVVKALLRLGHLVIVEPPTEHNACGNALECAEYFESESFSMSLDVAPTVLGSGYSHLGGKPRPILLLTGRHLIEKSYLGQVERFESPLISSTTSSKTVTFPTKSETRDWIQGINLWTHVHFCGGKFPHGDLIKKILDLDVSDCQDLRPWNIIFDGKNLHLIDQKDHRKKKYDVNKSKGKLIEFLTTGKADFEDQNFKIPPLA